jgi:hypothetical protein
MSAKVKTFTPEMQTKIANAASALGGVAPSYSEAAGKTYEAWVLFELAARLQAEGISVTACDHAGAPTKGFRVRGGPGLLPNVAEVGALPCHFLLEGPFLRAELHSSLRHSGFSDDTHELDVSVIDADYANVVREQGGGPIDVDAGSHHFPTILLGVELKEYESAVLPKVYPRALLGVAIDLTAPTPVVLIGRRPFVVETPEPAFWLATTSALGSSAPFLTYHGLRGRGDVQPSGAGEAALTEMAEQVASRLMSLI